RYVRTGVIPAMENVALWHERDISHSSVERMIAPDVCVVLDFALSRLTGLVENLVLYPENMLKNLNKLGGIVFSQRVLLALTQKGVSREDAYSIVQRNAMKVWAASNAGQKADLLAELLQDKDVTKKFSKKELSDLFDLKYHTKNVDVIFKRVFGKA
ncbi:MAG: adenylosuccinate lyase, partial [Rickettsiales bacterium]